MSTVKNLASFKTTWNLMAEMWGVLHVPLRATSPGDQEGTI